MSKQSSAMENDLNQQFGNMERRAFTDWSEWNMKLIIGLFLAVNYVHYHLDFKFQ